MDISVSERGTVLKSLIGVNVGCVMEATVSRLGFTVFTGEKLILLPKVDPGILLFCLRKFDEVLEGAGVWKYTHLSKYSLQEYGQLLS